MTRTAAIALLSTLLLVAFGMTGTLRAQQQAPATDPQVPADGIDPAAAKLFARVQPEFLRYQRLAIYGNTLASTQPAAELVDAEVKLYRDRRAAGTLDKPDHTDALLCFNLLLQRPDVGKEYLTGIVKAFTPGVDGFVDSAIAYGLMASGSWGEQFAVAGIKDQDVSRRRFWARYLSHEATEDASAKRIRELVAAEPDEQVRASLYGALGMLVDQEAVAAMKAAFAKEKDAKVRSAIVFALTEMLGRDALAWLQTLDVADTKVREEIQNSIEYLRTGTTEANKHGFEIGNDKEFAERFGDLDTPAIVWLRHEGLLEAATVAEPKKLAEAKKAALFDALDQSLGFGLEAVKGTLFVSLQPADLPRLRRLRALCAYCPNDLAQRRRSTLLIMIRSLRV